MKVRWWLFIVSRKRKHEQYPEALEVLHKVLAAQLRRALAFVQVGYCLTKLNRHEEALRSYARALEIAPNYGEAHAYMGLAYHDLGRYREALDSLNRAVRMKPSLTDDPSWLYMLGLTCGHAELAKLSDPSNRKRLPSLTAQVSQIIQDFGAGSFLLWPLLKMGEAIDKSWSDPPQFRVFLIGAILFVLGWAVRCAFPAN